MTYRTNIVLSVLAAAVLFATGACDDESTDDNGSSTSSGTTTSTSTTGAGGGGGAGGGSGVNCTTVCTNLFNCGLEQSAGAQLCPDWVAGDLDLYLNGCNGDDGCVATCTAMPALQALVNPDDCVTTVATLKSANPSFASACDGGIGGCGGGGGAGGGG